MNTQVTEADVIQTCEVHGFPLDPDQLEVVTAVVNQMLLSASKPAVAQDEQRKPIDFDIFGTPIYEPLHPDQCTEVTDHDEIARVRAAFGAMLAASPAAPAQSGEAKDWRVGLFYSSSNPRKQVRVLADGHAQIAEYEKHHSFVRWIDAAAPQPAQTGEKS